MMSRSRDRFIFNMGLPYLGEMVFILRRDPASYAIKPKRLQSSEYKRLVKSRNISLDTLRPGEIQSITSGFNVNVNMPDEYRGIHFIFHVEGSRYSVISLSDIPMSIT